MPETVEKVKCEKCKESWFPRVEKPAKCPFCGCRKWKNYGKEKLEEK